MPAHATTVTLECAGNGRAFLTPTVSGEQWELGAVSTAEWVGVALTDILDLAGVESAAHEVVFTGADGTPGSEGAGPNRFQRSLTIDEVQQSETLLAYSMNGEPLPPNHGYPLRVVVPGWYGVASVKWLTDIEVIGDFFSGYFQTEKYVYEWERDGHLVTEPVRQLRVRALVTQPSTAEVVEKGPLVVRGLAWSGVAPVARVEVSLNHGEWQAARLLGEGSKHAWQRWELSTQIDRPGRATVRARATDLAGRTQPDQPEWNRLGYGNNAVQDISFHVKGRRAR
jgi:DMSO/TMAO reductase YedYZ molybdopterin-dependent catalytic subunit